MSYITKKLFPCRTARNTYSDSTVKPMRTVLPSDMQKVEIIRVGPPASPLGHTLLKVGEIYYMVDPVIAQPMPKDWFRYDQVQTLSEEDFKRFMKMRSIVERHQVKVDNPSEAARRLNKMLREGYDFNLLTRNCMDFAIEVVTGEYRPQLYYDMSSKPIHWSNTEKI